MTIETLYRHIETLPGVAGGKPCIAGHRITVQNVVIWHERMGLSADEIATGYDDIYAALAYYYDHRQKIDDAIRDGDAFAEALRSTTPSKVTQKLNER